MKVNILGTEYKIVKKKYENYPRFKELQVDGECNPFENKIVICDMRTFPGYEDFSKEMIRTVENQTLRHELLHAFMYSSGLCTCANVWGGAWCENEEMIDWFAIQAPKIYKVYEELKILE